MAVKKSLSRKILISLISTQFLLSCDSDLFSSHEHSGSKQWEVSQLTEKELFTVTFSCQKKPHIGDFQSCQLLIKQGSQEISDAKVAIDGGMKLHGHGLPTSPNVSATDVAGQYNIDGLEFSMRGEWVVGFRISANLQTDQAVFKLSI